MAMIDKSPILLSISHSFFSLLDMPFKALANVGLCPIGSKFSSA